MLIPIAHDSQVHANYVIPNELSLQLQLNGVYVATKSLSRHSLKHIREMWGLRFLQRTF